MTPTLGNRDAISISDIAMQGKFLSTNVLSFSFTDRMLLSLYPGRGWFSNSNFVLTIPILRQSNNWLILVTEKIIVLSSRYWQCCSENR
ncbi:unnamed protein product [Victoria cruziana]